MRVVMCWTRSRPAMFATSLLAEENAPLPAGNSGAKNCGFGPTLEAGGRVAARLREGGMATALDVSRVSRRSPFHSHNRS